MFNHRAVIAAIRACAEDNIATGGGRLGDTPEALLAAVLLLAVGPELVITIHAGAEPNVTLGHSAQGENIKEREVINWHVCFYVWGDQFCTGGISCARALENSWSGLKLRASSCALQLAAPQRAHPLVQHELWHL